jgi:hypothetical protein
MKVPVFILFACTSLVAGCSNEKTGEVKALVNAEQLTRACVLTSACEIQSRPRVSNCLDEWNRLLGIGMAPIYGEIFRCVLRSQGNCAAVQSCFGAISDCTSSDFTAYCKANVAYTCDLLDKRVYTLDCSHAGLKCQVDKANPFAASCGCDGAFQRRCDGNVAVSCQGGQAIGVDCAARGMVCNEGACQFGQSPQSCDPRTFAAKCEGATALQCQKADGKGEHYVARVDCAQQTTLRRCEAGSCVRTDTACGDDFNRCTARGDMEACIDGSWKTFACTQMGLSDCFVKALGVHQFGNCGRSQ